MGLEKKTRRPRAHLDHLLLVLGSRSQSPLPGVGVSVHNTPLDLGDNTVVASRELDRRHLRDTDRNRFSLRRHQDDFLVEFNVGFCTRAIE